MFERVLVAIDGSPQAVCALDAAASISRAAGGHLTVMTVVENPWTRETADGLERLFPGDAADAQALLDKAMDQVRPPSDVETLVIWGPSVAEAILEHAERGDFDLIVLGCRGLAPARATLLGSVGRGVLDHSPIPVLVVRLAPADQTAVGTRVVDRSAGGHSLQIRRIVVGTDGSDEGLNALRWAGALAGVLGAHVVVVHACEIPAYPPTVSGIGQVVSPDATLAILERLHDLLVGEWTQPLRDAAVTYSTRLEEESDAAGAMLRVADEEDGDLIVVGRRGHGRWREVALGSVSHHVVHHANRAVAVVPPVSSAGQATAVSAAADRAESRPGRGGGVAADC